MAPLRLRYLCLAITTISLGLILQWFRSELPPVLADLRLQRAAVAPTICWGVEFSQLYHAPWLDGWRNTTFGHLVLGSGFDPRDLVAYGLGVLVGFRLESMILQRFANADTRLA